MNRILLASALVLSVSGAAMAQQAPYTTGNFSASVDQWLNPNVKIERPAANVDTTTTSSIATRQNDVRRDVALPTIGNVSIPLENGGR